ncbi:MAG: sigma-70 family RNA polymerase sigma factor [Bacteroidales bacterium]|nr:sigma-70 family RNA polymerase sigma factor [Bacteroidales bacterium]
MNDSTLKYFSELSDQELLSRVVAQDKAAIEYFFYFRFYPIFEKIVLHTLHNQVETEELINEFYIYLQSDNWSKLKTFEWKSSLSTWLTVVASRFFVKKKQELTKIDGEKVLNIDDFTNVLKTESTLPITRADLYDAIHKMRNPKHKWVLLSELMGYSTEEMAREMNTTVINIYNYKKRAKIELVELLNEKKDV